MSVLTTPPLRPRLDEALRLEHQGADAQALRALEALTVADPTWDLARLEAARVGLKVGDVVARAAFHADVARSLSPENPRAHYLWALAQDELGDRQAATAALQIALLMRPDFPDAQFRLAGLLSAQGRWPEATEAWRRVVAFSPAAGARAQLAEALEKVGDVASAEAELRALMKQGAGRPLATAKLIGLLERTGRAGEATVLKRSLASPDRAMRPLR